MPEVLRLALLALPAGVIGFIAAPCCSMLVPVYLPFAMHAVPPAPAEPRRQLVLFSQPASAPASGPAAIGAAELPAQPLRTRARALRSFVVFLAGFCLFFVLRIRLPGSDACVTAGRLRNNPLGAFGMGFACPVTRKSARCQSMRPV